MITPSSCLPHFSFLVLAPRMRATIQSGSLAVQTPARQHLCNNWRVLSRSRNPDMTAATVATTCAQYTRRLHKAGVAHTIRGAADGMERAASSKLLLP